MVSVAGGSGVDTTVVAGHATRSNTSKKRCGWSRVVRSQASVAKTLGLVEQTLFNGVKTSRQGQLNGANSKPVSAEQMEIARLRAELARVKMARDILGQGESAGRTSSEWPARRTRTSPMVGALLRQVRYAFIQRHRQVWPITV